MDDKAEQNINVLYPIEIVAYGDYRNEWVDRIQDLRTGDLYDVPQHHIKTHRPSGRCYVWKCNAMRVTE